MAHTPPTVADFRAYTGTKFASVSDETVQAYLDQGARQVDTTWAEADYAPAIMNWAAWALLDAGEGGTAVSGVSTPGLTRLKTGTLELGFSSAQAEAAAAGGYASNHYGRLFLMQRKQNRGGVRVTTPICPPVTPLMWATPNRPFP